MTTRDRILFVVLTILSLLAVACLSHGGQDEDAAYRYLTNSVAKVTKRSPSQFTYQRSATAPRLELTNAAIVTSNLTLGGSAIIRAKTAALSAGIPMNLSVFEMPVLTKGQAMIYGSTNR